MSFLRRYSSVLVGPALLGLLAPSGTAQGHKLSGPLARPIGGDIRSYQVSPDGERVIYVADEDTDEVFELFVAKPSVAGARFKLAGPSIEGGSISQAWIGPRSRHVVFTGDLETDELREFYSVPIDGGALVKLVSPPSWSPIGSVQIDSTETRVLFLARLSAASARRGVFSVPIGGGPAILLSDPARGVVSFQISPDGRRVVYVLDSVLELFSVPILGGFPVRLSPAGSRIDKSSIRIDPHSARVVFADAPLDPGEKRLYSAPLGGRRPAIELLPHPVRNVELLRISADGARVVCIAAVAAALELTSVPIDGRPGSAALFSRPIASAGFEAIELTPDGRTVVLEINQSAGATLFRVPIDGSQPATELAQTLASGIELSADGRFVVFHAPTGLSIARVDASAAPIQLASDFANEFAITHDSTRVVYEAFLEGTDSRELFSVPIAGAKAPVRLHSELPYRGTVQNLGSGFQISSITGRLIFRASLQRNDLFELFSVPVGGGAAPLRINGELPIGTVEGDVWRMALSSDGAHAVYVADQETDGVVELFSVRTDGRGGPTKLCESLAIDQQVFEFDITPDGNEVVYRIEELQGGPNRILVVPIEGGPSVVLATGEGHGDLLIDRSGTRVVFTAAVASVNKQFSVPIDASSAPVELPGPAPSGSRITTPDGSRVLYGAALSGNTGGLFSVPIDGSASAVRLDGSIVEYGGVRRFEVDALGSRVVYLADQFARARFELFSIPVDGSAGAIRLNPPLAGNTLVTSFELAPTGFVFYTSDQAVRFQPQLYRVPIDGSAVATQVNPVPVAGGSVQDFLITPDGSRAVYQADQEVDGRSELFSVASDGSGPVRKLNGPLGDGDVGGDPAPDRNAVLAMSPDGARVVFTAGPAARGAKRLFSAPSDGSAPALEISAPLQYGLFGLSISELRFTSGGTAVVYSALASYFDGFALYHAPLDQGRRAKRVSEIGNGDAARFRAPPFALTPDGKRLVFLNDQQTRGVAELFETLLPLAVRVGMTAIR